MNWRIAVPLVVVASVLAAAIVWLVMRDDPAPAAEPPATTPIDGLDDGLPEQVSGSITLYGVPPAQGILDLLKVGFETSNPDANLTVEVLPGPSMVQKLAASPQPGVFVAQAGLVSALKDQSGAIGEPQAFGRNVFTIVVPPGNPGGITGLADLAAAKNKRALICGPVSSYGNMAETLLDRAGVAYNPVQVGKMCGRDAVTAVASNQLDLALVQRTGIRPNVAQVAIADADNVEVPFAMAQVTQDPLGAAFLTFVGSEAGQAILTDRGFVP